MAATVLELKPAAPAEEKSKYKPDDDELALELAARMDGKAAFFHSAWRVYDAGVWAYRDAAEFRRYIRVQLRQFRSHGVAVTQQRIRGLAAMLEDDLYVSDQRIMEMAAERRRYVNLRNGLFNLETMELEPHRPELYFHTQLDFDYDPEADCPTFRQYLITSLVHPDGTHDNSLITLVNEALAYSMTARTDLKASFWLVGAKDSGKSTFISVLKHLMGDLHATIDLTQLGTNRFLLAGIAGKRVVSFTEATASTVLPDALYKTITGGQDEIFADVKNRDAITFVPEAKIWWAMNEMPRISDRSGATTRRITIIPFNRSIPQEKRILNLEAKLRAERSGIFNTMLNHYHRIIQQGRFSRCAQSEALMQEYVAENDTEAAYADERLDRHETHRVTSAELYADYRQWCEQFGFRPRNANQVAGEWKRLGLVNIKSGGVKWWTGAKLRGVDVSAIK